VFVGAGSLFGLTMIMVSICLVMSVIVTNIYLRKDSQTRVPRCLRRLFLCDAVAEPPTHTVPPPPPPPPPPPTSNGKLRQTAAGRDGGVWTVDGQGRRDVELPGHRCRTVDSIHLSAVEDDVDVLRRRLTPLSRDLDVFPSSPRRCAQRLDRAVSSSRCKARGIESTEWQDLARIVDRLFFWMFMVSSIALLTGLYVNVALS